MSDSPRYLSRLNLTHAQAQTVLAMKQLQYVEHSQGVGHLCRERTLRLQVAYDVDIYQQLEDPPSGAVPKPGLQEIRGLVTGLVEGDLWYLWHQPVTLILSDGREFELELGLNGEIVPHCAKR